MKFSEKVILVPFEANPRAAAAVGQENILANDGDTLRSRLLLSIFMFSCYYLLKINSTIHALPKKLL